MSSTPLHPPEWTLGRRDAENELRIAGDWIACRTGLRHKSEARRIIDATGTGTLRIECAELGRWDSALVAFLRMVRDRAHAAKGVRIDDAGVPQAARQLLALASTGDASTTGQHQPPRKSLLPSAFTTAFYKMTGVTPTAYRHSLQRGSAAREEEP